MMTITLTTEQLNKIKGFVVPPPDDANFKPNYADMYQYIFDKLGSQMPQQQTYWFEQASEINRYLNKPNNSLLATQSAYFIQQMNKESLKNAGQDTSDVNIQSISNHIGEQVYLDIAQYKEIPASVGRISLRNPPHETLSTCAAHN